MARLLITIALALTSLAAHAQTVVLHSSRDMQAALRAYSLARVWEPAFIARDLAPGTHWRDSIAAKTCSSRRVLVIWSANAAASQEVGAEIAAAQACRAFMVPVMLDSTPLPPALAGIHAVDWR